MPQPINTCNAVVLRPTPTWMLQPINTCVPQIKKYMWCLSQQVHVIPQPTTTWMPQPMSACVPDSRNTCNAPANKYMLHSSQQPMNTSVQQSRTTYYSPATKYMLCLSQKMYRYKLCLSNPLHGYYRELIQVCHNQWNTYYSTANNYMNATVYSQEMSCQSKLQCSTCTCTNEIDVMPQLTNTWYTTENDYMLCHSQQLHEWYSQRSQQVHVMPQLTIHKWYNQNNHMYRTGKNTCYATPTKTTNFQYGIGLKNAQMTVVAMRTPGMGNGKYDQYNIAKL